MSVSKKFFGLIAAALMMGAVAGCGGGGDNPTVIDDNVTINGGIGSDEATTAEAISAGTDRTTTVLINGTSREVQVAPTTSAAPAGTQLAVFPANVPIIGNLTRGAGISRAPGQLIINGNVVPNVTVDEQGRLSEPVAFLPSSYANEGEYEVRYEGPWNITAGSRTLTVGEFIVTFQVNAEAATSFPTTITGKLPSNGGSTLDGESFVTFTTSGAFAGHSARLTVAKSNGNISKRIEVAGTGGTFSDISNAGGNASIPAGGVDIVHFHFPSDEN